MVIFELFVCMCVFKIQNIESIKNRVKLKHIFIEDAQVFSYQTMSQKMYQVLKACLDGLLMTLLTIKNTFCRPEENLP